MLLVEFLDGAGASEADASAHLATLERAGFTGRALAVERRSNLPAGEESAPAYAHVARVTGQGEVRAVLEEFRPDVVVVASAAIGGGPAVGWLPSGTRVLWWPTGFGGEQTTPSSASRAPGIRIGAAGRHKACLDPATDPFAGIEGSVIETAAERRVRHGLWDGDYVLCPISCGAAALRAFASVASAWDSLDLVMLVHPDPGLVQLAREIGIGTRVHFAGPAPRRAEYAWARAAAAALVSGSGPLSGGVVLRLLASGCPVLPVGEAGPIRRLREWLEARGCAAAPGSEQPERALERVIDRESAVERALERALERGRALAVEHEIETFAPRVAAALRSEIPPGLAAA